MTVSLSQKSKVLNSFFLLYFRVERYQNILKLRCKPLAFTSYEVFSKSENRSGNRLTNVFSGWFVKKNIYHVIFYQLTKSRSLIAFLLNILGNMCIAIVFFPGCDVINFEFNLNLLNKTDQARVIRCNRITRIYHYKHLVANRNFPTLTKFLQIVQVLTATLKFPFFVENSSCLFFILFWTH